MSVKGDFNCDQCPRKFLQQGQLVVHMRQHTGEKPFVCEYCKKGFASSKVLKVHIRIHTGERPYKCPFCERRFSAYANLVVHRRIHTNEKPYVCELCCRAFEHSGNLSRHFQAHLINDGLRCILCSKTFDKKEDILEHTKKVHTIDYQRYISYGNPVKVSCRQEKKITALTLNREESKNGPSDNSEIMVISSSQANSSKSPNIIDNKSNSSHPSPPTKIFRHELETNGTESMSENPALSDTIQIDSYVKERSKDSSGLYINSVGSSHLKPRRKRPLSSPVDNYLKLESYEEHRENEYECKNFSNGNHLNSPPGNSSSITYTINSDQHYYPKKIAKLSHKNNTPLDITREERSHTITKSPPPLPPLIPIDQEFTNESQSEQCFDYDANHRNSPTNVNQRQGYVYRSGQTNSFKYDSSERSNIINSFMKSEPYENKDFHNHINKLIHSIKMCFKEVMSSQSNGMEIWSKVERNFLSILQKFEIDLRKCLEVNYEQFLIHFLDAAGKNPCADVRVCERQRMEINMKKLLEISLQ